MNTGKLTLEGNIRRDILTAAYKAGKIGAHIAPSLSIVEICVAILSVFDRQRDTFVLSKAHGALGYYAAMYRMGFITKEQFESFEENGGEFPGQPSRSSGNHISYSGGSLGMGLSYAAGRAWASPDSNVYVVIGDGELDEGSNWEAAAVIARYNITNLTAIVDCNGLQSDGQCRDVQNKDLKKIWESHGWRAVSCQGHSAEQIRNIITDTVRDKPLVIMAQTVKGKGISFMENNNKWHHNKLEQEEFDKACEEVAAVYGL